MRTAATDRMKRRHLNRVYLPPMLVLFTCPEHGDRAIWNPANGTAFCYDRDEVLLDPDEDVLADATTGACYLPVNMDARTEIIAEAIDQAARHMGSRS